jgi:hypothetical protein
MIVHVRPNGPARFIIDQARSGLPGLETAKRVVEPVSVNSKRVSG